MLRTGYHFQCFLKEFLKGEKISEKLVHRGQIIRKTKQIFKGFSNLDKFQEGRERRGS